MQETLLKLQTQGLASTLIAHRGATKHHTENTLRAFERALKRGAGVECDIALTKDGEAVVFHVPFYNSTIVFDNGHRCRLNEISWVELKSLTIQGDHIPHLNELMALLRQYDEMFFLEPKILSDKLAVTIAQAIVDFGLQERALLIAFANRRRMLTVSKQLHPGVRTGVILVNPFCDWTRLALDISADAILPGWKTFNHLRFAQRLGLDIRAKITDARGHDLEVYCGLANSPQDLVWLYDLGVNGIVTDEIEIAPGILRNHVLLSSLL